MIGKISRWIGGVAFLGTVLTFGVGVWMPHHMNRTIGNILHSMFALALLAWGLAAFDLTRDNTSSKTEKKP